MSPRKSHSGKSKKRQEAERQAAENRRLREEAYATVFRAVASGRSHAEVATKYSLSVARVREIVRGELDKRRPDDIDAHVGLQVARLHNALSALSQAMERGEWKAAGLMPSVLGALDRYQGVEGALREAARALPAPAPAARLAAPSSLGDGAELPR